MRLKDKVAIITGSGSGIGKAAALIFAREGAKVVVADINESSAKKTVEEIEAKGGEAIPVQVDVTDESQVKQMTQAAKEKFGKLDVLFIREHGPVHACARSSTESMAVDDEREVQQLGFLDRRLPSFRVGDRVLDLRLLGDAGSRDQGDEGRRKSDSLHFKTSVRVVT